MEDRFNQNYFELFNMEVKTNIDHKNLDQKYNTYQKQFHPDNFVNSTNYEKKLSLKYISYINEAYKTLKNDYFRGVYLLKLEGHDIQDNSLDNEFLLDQMDLREKIDEAKKMKDHVKLNKIQSDIVTNRDNCFKEFETLYKSNNYEESAKKMGEMKFFISIENDIKNYIDL